MAVQTVPDAADRAHSPSIAVNVPKGGIQLIHEHLSPIVWEATKLQSMLKVMTGFPGEAFRTMDDADQEQFMESCADKIKVVIDMLIGLGQSAEGKV